MHLWALGLQRVQRANMNLDWSILETEEVIVSHFLVIGIRSIPRQHLMNRSRSFMFDFLSSSLKV